MALHNDGLRTDAEYVRRRVGLIERLGQPTSVECRLRPPLDLSSGSVGT
jgi:hypothetical protein